MTCDEFGVSFFGNANYDDLLKSNLNVSSEFVIRWRFCCVVLADVHNNEYSVGSF
jgi:hypothetical protein